MSTTEQTLQPLVNGDRMSRDEFLRRWDALPHLQFAELLEGVVYVPPPLIYSHGAPDAGVTAWLVPYTAFTPGCRASSNVAYLMREDAPQPDCSQRIFPEFGGQSGMERGLGSGAPELIVEVVLSSIARDLGPKLRLYRAAGVLEYITVSV